MLEDAPVVVRSRPCDSGPELLVVPGSNEVLDGGSIARRRKAVIAHPRERPHLAKCLALCLGAHALADRPAAIVMAELDGAQPSTVSGALIERPLPVRALASHRGSPRSLKSLLKYDDFRRSRESGDSAHGL
jgi:hypothetical protein